jgi:hypothetical protein
MREFKFRAWDTETKEMSYDFLSKNWLKVCVKSPYVEIMQYTGLKDKNGKEIYEGDIIGISDSKFKIYYASQSARYRAENLDTGWHFDLDELFTINDWEVVGNIFETL